MPVVAKIPTVFRPMDSSSRPVSSTMWRKGDGHALLELVVEVVGGDAGGADHPGAQAL